jgi:hypothetical protein
LVLVVLFIVQDQQDFQVQILHLVQLLVAVVAAEEEHTHFKQAHLLLVDLAVAAVVVLIQLLVPQVMFQRPHQYKDLLVEQVQVPQVIVEAVVVAPVV